MHLAELLQPDAGAEPELRAEQSAVPGHWPLVLPEALPLLAEAEQQDW